MLIFQFELRGSAADFVALGTQDGGDHFIDRGACLRFAFLQLTGAMVFHGDPDKRVAAIASDMVHKGMTLIAFRKRHFRCSMVAGLIALR
jgi:hypothetical protein